MDHDPPAPPGRRTVIQKAREARGFPARRLTVEEREQQELLWFEAAFSPWIVGKSEVVRQQRQAFERGCNVPWREEAFAEWLSAEAKAEVCAELGPLRQAFVDELEAIIKVSLAPQDVRAIIRHARHVVRRARWRSQGRATAKGSQLTDYGKDRNAARAKVKAQVRKIQGPLRKLTAALRSLPEPEDDMLASDFLSRLQWLVEGSQLGQALETCDLDGDPTEKLASALQELGQKLQGWPPRDRPLWRDLLEPLVRIFEKASGNRPTASWTTPRSRPGRGSSDASEGRPGNAFTAFLVVIYDALPADVRPFVSTTRGGVYGHAQTLLGKRKARKGRPKAQDDGSE